MQQVYQISCNKIQICYYQVYKNLIFIYPIRENINLFPGCNIQDFELEMCANIASIHMIRSIYIFIRPLILESNFEIIGNQILLKEQIISCK